MYHVSFISVIRRTHVQVYTYSQPRSEVHPYRSTCIMFHSSASSNVHMYRCTHTVHQGQKYTHTRVHVSCFIHQRHQTYTCTGVNIQSTKVRGTPVQVYIMYNPSRPVQHHAHLITIRRTPVSYIMYIMYNPSRSKVHTFRCTSCTTHQGQKYISLVGSFIYRLLFQGQKFTLHNPARSRARVSEVHVFGCVIVYSP